MMENDLLELIKKRHSTRAAFDPDKKVAKNDLEKILESATWSPTAHNMQNFNILLIDDKGLLEKIGNISNKSFIENTSKKRWQICFLN